MRLAVLYVCTGNVCRSPMAELQLRAWSRRGAGLVVSSCGTAALVDQGVDDGSAQALAAMRIDAGGHVARRFEPALAEQADLVLTAERSHRDLVMTGAPGAFRRTFTMAEFARLGRHLHHSDNPHKVIAQAAALRGVDGFVPAERDGILDPYRRPAAVAAEAAGLIAATVRSAIDMLDLRPAPVRRAQAGWTPRPIPGARRASSTEDGQSCA